MSTFPETKFPYVVVLDNIRSAHNVGAIFRTCDGAGAQELILCGITPYPPHNKIPKTALGAEEYVKWSRSDKTVERLLELKQQGFTIVAVEQSSKSQPYYEIDYPEKTALVFGHELSGVDPQVLEMADHIAEIPMFGQKNSLSNYMSVGIICYHLAVKYYQSGK